MDGEARMIEFSDKQCFICGSRDKVEVHHIFGAANRARSDKDGMTIYLCSECHREGRYAVHQNADTAQLIHAVGELMWLAKHPGAGVWEFAAKYGRNYLRDWEGLQ